MSRLFTLSELVAAGAQPAGPDPVAASDGFDLSPPVPHFAPPAAPELVSLNDLLSAGAVPASSLEDRLRITNNPEGEYGPYARQQEEENAAAYTDPADRARMAQRAAAGQTMRAWVDRNADLANNPTADLRQRTATDPYPAQALEEMDPAQAAGFRRNFRTEFAQGRTDAAAQPIPGWYVPEHLAAGNARVAAVGQAAVGEALGGGNNPGTLPYAPPWMNEGAQSLAGAARSAMDASRANLGDADYVEQNLPQHAGGKVATQGIKLGEQLLMGGMAGPEAFGALFAADAAGNAYAQRRDLADAGFSAAKAFLLAKLPAFLGDARAPIAEQLGRAFVANTAMGGGDAAVDAAWNRIVHGEKIGMADVEHILQTAGDDGATGALVHGATEIPGAVASAMRGGGEAAPQPAQARAQRIPEKDYGGFSNLPVDRNQVRPGLVGEGRGEASESTLGGEAYDPYKRGGDQASSLAGADRENAAGRTYPDKAPPAAPPPAQENAAGRDMLVVEPGPTSANEPPREPQPTEQPPAPVKAKPAGQPRPFSKRDIEQRLVQNYDQTEGQSDFERRTQAESLEDQTGNGAAGVFRDRIPPDLINRFTRREWADVLRRRIVRRARGDEQAGGEDAISETGMGIDRFEQMVRDQLSGTDAGKLRAALAHAKTSPDPEIQLLAAIHENMPPAKDKGPTQVINPSEQPTGTRFSLHGAQFEIVETPDGHRLLKDGDEYPAVPADYIDKMPADKGSVQPPAERPKFFDPEAAGIKSSAGTGIFGQTTFEPATGNRQGSMFHEPVEIKGPAESAEDARIRGKFAEGERATGQMFGAPEPGKPDVAEDLRAKLRDPATADALYDSLPGAKTEGGALILNGDTAREATEHYRTRDQRLRNTAATARPASDYIADRYVRELDKGKDRGKTVLFLAGGAASGKSTAARELGIDTGAGLVVDSNMAGTPAQVARIDAAIARGWDVDVQFVYRPYPLAAESMLNRAHEEGRYIPMGEGPGTLASLHHAAANTFLELRERYKDNPHVDFNVVDNSGGIGDLRPMPVERFAEIVKNEYTSPDALRSREAEVLAAARGRVGDDVLDAVRSAPAQGAEQAEPTSPHRGLAEGPGEEAGRQPAEVTPAPPVESPRIEDWTERTFVVRGVEHDPYSVFGREGLRGLWNDEAGGYVFSKGRRGEVEAEMAKMAKAADEGTVPPDPEGDDVPFAPSGGTSNAPSYAFKQPKQMAGGTTPKVTSVDLIKQVEAVTGTPVRVGHGKFAQRKAAGWYSLINDVTRLKEAEALDVAYHEAGHSIHKKLIGWNLRWPKGVAVEMQKMGRELYGNRQPNGGYRREGLAEYVARRLLGDDVAKAAPKTHDWFNNTVMPAHPEFAKKWAKLEEMAKDWQDQGAAARVAGKIHALDRGIKAKLTTAYEKLSDVLSPYAWTNDAHPLERAQKELLKSRGIDPDSLPITTDPAKMRAALKMTAPGTARYFIEKAAVDTSYREVGPSLKNVLEPVKDRLGEFVLYAVARRAKTLHARGINSGIPSADAARVVKDLDSPEFKKASDGITQWSDRLVDYVVDAGALSPDAAKAIRDANPVYLPFKRYFDENHLGGAGGGQRRGLVNQGSAIKRIKGSGRSIVDPLESLALQAEHMITLGNKSRVARSIAELADRAGKAAWFAEKVDLNMKVQHVSVEQLQRQLESLGADLSQVDLDKLLTVVSQPTSYTGKDNIVSLWRNGQQEFWELHPDIYKVVTEMDKEALPPFFRFFTAPARGVRLGATALSAAFQVSNMVRDAFTAAVYGKGFRTPLATIRGIVADKSGSPAAERFHAAGGAMGTLMGQDRAAARRALDETLAEGVKGRVMATIKHPVDALRAAFEFGESAPRIVEFRRAYDEAIGAGKTEQQASLEALLASKEITLNFTRHGTYGAAINQLVPFFNARAQGASKFLRTFAQDPRVALPAIAKAFTWITAPSLALWWLNKDEDWYKELPDYERFNNWHFSFDGGKHIFRLPMPETLGKVFGAVPVATLDHAYQKHPRETSNAMWDAFASMLPVGSVGEVMPAIIKPLIETGFNYDAFRKRAIVPSYDVEQKLPKDQYQKWTTETSKKIGEWLNVSPAKIDHVISGYTGGAVLNIIRWVEALGGAKHEPLTGTDVPVLSRFMVKSPLGRGYSVERFYSRLTQLRQKKGSNALQGEETVQLHRMEAAARRIAAIRNQVEGGRITQEEGLKKIQAEVSAR